MSLDPRYLQLLPDSLVEMYALAEADILKDMARRIAAYDYFIPSAQHQLQKLTELGGVQKDIIKTFSSMTGKTQGEIVALLTEAGAASIADDTEYYKAAQVYAPNKIDKEALYAQLNAGLLQTQQAFKNITGTTANTATKQFENTLDRAWTQINVGGFDYNTTIRSAIKSLSESGIGAVRYKSGRVDSIEVAVRRAVVTGANQTAAKTQEVLADELGVDLVEVTAHSGARPSHAVWQGKCYSRSDRKTVDGVTYEDLRTATGYGSGAGLCGWNCRHNMHPYVPGAPRTWTDEQLRRLDEKSIAYNGEKYSEYEASQIQRGIEREIRKQKRTVAALEAAGQDASAEKAKLRTAQRAYSDFTAQTGLKKQPARAQVGTVTNTVQNKAFSEPENRGIIKKNRTLSPVSLSLKNIDELNQWQNDYYTENKNIEFTKAANPAISQYSGGAYSAINAIERGGVQYEKALRNYGSSLEKYCKISDQLSQELSKFKLHTDIKVKRVVGEVGYITGSGSSIEAMKSVVGKIYTEKGFTSTTIAQDAQLPFGGMKDTATVLDIVVPKGTRGAYIYKMADNPAEFEFLIDKNTDFKIIEAGERQVEKIRYNARTREWEKVKAQERYMKMEVVNRD